MKIIVLVLLAVVLLLLIYFSILKSRFGAGLGGTTAPSDDGKYKVEINFNYQNPASFGANNAKFKCILLYLEQVGDLDEIITYDPTVLPSKTDIFNSKNIFYKEYYSNFNRLYTNNKIYYRLFNDKIDGAGNIQKDSIFIDLPQRINIDGSIGNTVLYDRLGLINIINSGSEPDVVSAYNNFLNDFIDPYYIPIYANPENQQFSVDGYDKATLITEVDTNNNTIMGANSKISATNEKVYFKTVSSTQFFNLYLSPGQYKFGMAIVNDRSTIQTDDYNIFPYTISDFRLTDTLLQVNGEFAPSNSQSATGLSAVIEYVKDTTPPVISNINITEIGETSANFVFTSNETGKVFTLAKRQNQSAPSFDDILNSGANNDMSIGNNIILIENLTPSTNYTLYSVFRDNNNNYYFSSNNRINNINFTTQSI
jgi:hypothetical protein